MKPSHLEFYGIFVLIGIGAGAKPDMGVTQAVYSGFLAISPPRPRDAWVRRAHRACAGRSDAMLGFHLLTMRAKPVRGMSLSIWLNMHDTFMLCLLRSGKKCVWQCPSTPHPRMARRHKLFWTSMFFILFFYVFTLEQKP